MQNPVFYEVSLLLPPIFTSDADEN
jgi:hypothetical protein